MNINKHFLNSWGIKELIDVPIQRDVHTLNSPSQRCHQNTAYIQFKFGGQTVLGFSFYQYHNEIRAENHSIWKTPNDELVDVSLSGLSDDYKSIKFAPMKTFDSFEEYYNIFHSYVLRPDTFTHRFAYDEETHSYDWFKDKDLSQLVFHKKQSMMKSDLWESYIEERWEDYANQ